MHGDNRQSVRTAERKKIAVEIITENFEEYFEIFYELMVQTATRNGFSLHLKDYYATLFKSLLNLKKSYLVVAKYEQRVLVVKVVVVFGTVANDIFTGSSNEERNRRPTYLAIWKAICHAREINCYNYNFGGISAGNGVHKLDGVTSFKKKFGGYMVDHSNFYDIIYQPFWYFIYSFRKLIKNKK
jgi:lipid II:glycine glycyltransferase (peptidoglycan interpeptide bridge formation enzyme)